MCELLMMLLVLISFSQFFALVCLFIECYCVSFYRRSDSKCIRKVFHSDIGWYRINFIYSLIIVGGLNSRVRVDTGVFF